MTSTDLVPQLRTYVEELSQPAQVDEVTLAANAELGTLFSKKTAIAIKGYPLIDLKKVAEIFKDRSQEFNNAAENFAAQKYVKTISKFEEDVEYYTTFPNLEKADSYGARFNDILGHTPENAALNTQHHTVDQSLALEQYAFDRAPRFFSLVMPTPKTYKRVCLEEHLIAVHDKPIPTKNVEDIKAALDVFDSVRIWDMTETEELPLGIDEAIVTHNKNKQIMSSYTYRTQRELNRIHRSLQKTAVYQGMSALGSGMKSIGEGAANAFAHLLEDPLAIGIKNINGEDYYYFVSGWE